MTARQPQATQDSVLVSLAVAAENLGVSVKTLRRRISDGTVHGYRVGRLIRVDLDEVRKALVVEIPTVCQWPLVSAHGRPVNVPAGGQ